MFAYYTCGIVMEFSDWIFYLCRKCFFSFWKCYHRLGTTRSPNKLLELIIFSPELNSKKSIPYLLLWLLKWEIVKYPSEVHNVSRAFLVEECSTTGQNSITEKGAVMYVEKCNCTIVKTLYVGYYHVASFLSRCLSF
jgi:hypothetical protein